MNLFTRIRLWVYIALIVSSAVVLGLTGNFANKFLPSLHRDFGIFSLVVPSLTIVLLIILLLRSQPRVDVFFAFVLAVLWLTMGAWSVDIIGGVECDALGGNRTPTKNGSTMSSQQYCREMKAIEAFSWGNFVMLIIAFAVLISLVSRAQSLGRHHIWGQSISELPWFGQWPESSHHNGQSYSYPQYAQGGYVVHQQPGHSVLIQQGQGGTPNIQQVPGTVVTA